MNKVDRAPYLAETKKADYLLCYACEFRYDNCSHPLRHRLPWNKSTYGMEMDPSSDCWGFRPRMTVAELKTYFEYRR